jgi:hypothetical protein
MGRTGESTDVGREDPIRVVLAEDHAEFRLGLKEMLATDGASRSSERPKTARGRSRSPGRCGRTWSSLTW